MKKQLTKIYTIFTFSKLDEEREYSPISGSKRLWGFYTSLEESRDVVENNITDIWEYLYDYALIEEVEEGFPFSMKRWLFKFNRETWKYEPIEEPKSFKQICNITMG